MKLSPDLHSKYRTPWQSRVCFLDLSSTLSPKTWSIDRLQGSASLSTSILTFSIHLKPSFSTVTVRKTETDIFSADTGRLFSEKCNQIFAKKDTHKRVANATTTSADIKYYNILYHNSQIRFSGELLIMILQFQPQASIRHRAHKDRG